MSAGGAIPIAGTMLMELVGPGKTRLVYDHCRPVGVNAEDFEATLDYGIWISKEDQWIVPLIQRNLDAGVYDRGPLSPRHENDVFHLHEMVREALGSAVPDGSRAPSAFPGATASPEAAITSV